MKSLTPVAYLLIVLLGLAPAARAQDCSGKPAVIIDDRCRASYVEIETENQGLRRLYDGDRLCFVPRQRLRWIWFCRGYEETARCRTKHDGKVAVLAFMEKGAIQWSCYER